MTNSKGLLALALGTFALGLAEFSMMGIISPIAKDLGINLAEAGDFISAYALGVSLGAPLPLLCQRLNYKQILLGLSLMILAGNLFASLSWNYWSLLLGRFLSGLPHGAYFGVGAIVASMLAEPGRRATAVAIMVAGMTVANLAGVPCSTWLTNTVSWRLTFALAATAALSNFLAMYLWLPSAGKPANSSPKKTLQFLRSSAPWLIFLAVFTGQGSIYCWYSYMEPIALNVAHIPVSGMKWVMVIAGLGMFLGGILSGKLADRYNTALVCFGTAMCIVPILLGIYFFSSHTYFSVLLTFMGSAALFALGGPLQYLITRFSTGGEILGGAGIQIAFNMSNALAAWLGGWIITRGYTAPALLGVPMAVSCVMILWIFYKKYGSLLQPSATDRPASPGRL